MSEPIDMDAPVTRRELHDALGIWGGALRADIANDIVTQVKALLKVLEDKLMVELRSQTSGIATYLEGRFNAFEQHYGDLPGRVSKLEAKVFGPSPRRRRRAR